MSVGNELRARRLANQHLSAPRLEDPTDLVAHLGAVQAQDYPAAIWALAVRLRNPTNARLQQAFADGKFLRTHVLRPTWHFVAPADIRWMLALTGPRVKAAMRHSPNSVEERVLAEATAAIARALEGGHSRTRPEIGDTLREAGFSLESPRVGHILGWAELEGVITSGPPRGRQHTYMLLEERVPPAPALERDAALAELVWRYFNSHGPALVQDCSWWSGLTLTDVRRGLEMNQSRLSAVTVDDRTYWSGPVGACDSSESSVHLLPNFDEYTVAYRARDLYFDPQLAPTGNPREDVPFRDVIVACGRVAGRWRRSTGESAWWIQPSSAMQRDLQRAARRYAEFVNGSAT